MVEGEEDVVAAELRGAGDPVEVDGESGREQSVWRDENGRLGRNAECGVPHLGGIDSRDSFHGIATCDVLHCGV